MSDKCLLIINALISTFDLSLDTLPEWVNDCYSDYPLESIMNIRKLLSKDLCEPAQHKIINKVIESGVVPQIMKLLQHNVYQFKMLCSGYIRNLNLQYLIPQEIVDYIDIICIMDKLIDDKLQDEGRWILTNITSGTPQQTQYIVDNGGIPILIAGITQKTSISVKLNSIQALGNIAGTNIEYRDLLLSNDILSTLLPIVNDIQQIDLLRCTTWSLSNLCRGYPSPETECIELMLHALSKLIKVNDADILSDTCWSLSYLTDPELDDAVFLIQMIVEWVDRPWMRLVQLLDDKEYIVRHPALRTIGNIIASSDEYTEDMIKLGILDKLYKLMYDDERSIKREALWVASNITSDSDKENIESMVRANLFHPLINMLQTEKYDIAKEALWTIYNATKVATDSQIAFLVYKGVITALCQFLTKQTDEMQPKVIMIGLEGIGYILEAGKRLNKYGPNEFTPCVEENNGVTCLEQIQSNQSLSVDIRNKADEMIKQYFNEQESI